MAPPSRQERLQMRQRGAGARKINNVDFGFSFGLTPGRVQRSGRKTPQSSNTGARRPSKTPSQSRRQSSAPRSVRSASFTTNSEPGALLGDKNPHIEEPVARRRKTKDSQIPESHVAPLFPSTSISSTSPSGHDSKTRRTTRPAFVQIAEDPENAIVSEQLAEDGAILKGPIYQFLQSENENIIDKENVVPDEHVSKNSFVLAGKQKRKPKKRRSIGQQSGRRKKRPSSESIEVIAEEPSQDNTPGSVDEEPEWETVMDEEFSSLPQDISEPTTEMPAVDKKRRKRKSIVLKPRKRRRSGDFSTQSIVSPVELLRNEEANAGETVKQAIPAEPTPRTRYGIATRKRALDAFDIQNAVDGPVYEPEVEGDETYIDEAISPEKPALKVPPKKPKVKVRRGRRSGTNLQSSLSQKADACSRMKNSSRPTFPILTQQMTNISALPTIEEDIEDYLVARTESCSVKTKFPERSAPNAIDVLAQICREIISIMISKLSTTSTRASTGEVKRKRTAIEAFGSEVDSQFFDMSVAIEHQLVTEERVKKAKKAKMDAQNEWMELRRQREEIALKCDDIRARNQTTEANGKETYELSEQLHELEMLIEKPELDTDCGAGAGLEYMLRSVAMTVSSAAGAGNGLLTQVKDYNRQLERTALLFEGRDLD